MVGIKEAENFDELSKGLALIEVYKIGCKPCEQLIPILEEISRGYDNKIAFYKANYANEQVIGKLGIKIAAAPTIVLLRDGQVIESFPGVKFSGDIVSEIFATKHERAAVTSDFLKRKLDKFLSRYYQATQIQQIGEVS